VSCTYQVGRSWCDCRPYGSSSHECKQTRIRFPSSLYLSGDRPRCLILALYASETGGAGQVSKHAEFIFNLPNLFFLLFSLTSPNSFIYCHDLLLFLCRLCHFLFLHTTLLFLFIVCFFVYLSSVSARPTRFKVGVINEFGWQSFSSTWVICYIFRREVLSAVYSYRWYRRQSNVTENWYI